MGAITLVRHGEPALSRRVKLEAFLQHVSKPKEKAKGAEAAAAAPAAAKG